MREQNIKEVLGGNIKFHEELPRIEKEKLVAVKFILRDGKIIEDWDGNWGVTDFALLMIQMEDGKEYTTLCGGVAVTRQIRKLLRRGRLPGRIWCFLNYLANEEGQNYYLLDWQETSPGAMADATADIKAPEEKTAVQL